MHLHFERPGSYEEGGVASSSGLQEQVLKIIASYSPLLVLQRIATDPTPPSEWQAERHEMDGVRRPPTAARTSSTANRRLPILDRCSVSW